MSKKRHRGARRQPWARDRSREFTRNAVERAPLGCQEALREFAIWLEERGLGEESITGRVTSARSFVRALTPSAEVAVEVGLRKLEARAVEEFFVTYSRDHGPAARRSMQAAMRLFLQFAASRGWSRIELAQAVPSLRTYGLRHLPKGLSEENIGRLLRSVSVDGVSARERSIVYLLVTYGARRGQVTELQLGDLDWRKRTIRFVRHKGGKEVRHSLTPAVAQALADYLRHERPEGHAQAVFLRARSPHLPLGPGAVTQMIHSRLERLGMAGRVPHGPHSLRHAFATRLLRSGESLKSIADLLGHRSLFATAIYAKVDHPRLFEVAVEWPEARS